MIARASLTPCRTRQRGVSMVETMVGILIGMIVIVVIYNVLSVAEGYRRATIGASDSQITGLLSQFVAGRDASSGGAGLTMSGTDLIQCVANEAGLPITATAVTSLDAALRPIPVLITDGGAAGVSDSFIAFNAGAAHVMWPVNFMATSNAGTPITVQSPNGFTVPPPTPLQPYWAIVMTNEAGGKCKMITLVNAVPDPVLPLTGKVTLTQDAANATTINYNVGPPAKLLNLGPDGFATRIQYDVDAINGVLRTTNLLVVPPTVATPVPVAQNIVLMKVQYGVDNTGDGAVDCWTPADNSTACGDFSVAAVRAAPLAKLNQILAVRIGVVVRSDEPDLKLTTDPANAELQAEARAILNATRPPTILFNCSTNNAACQSRVVVPAGAGVSLGSSNCAPAAVICDYWRYRTYETVIPLRNAIFSATMPP